MGSFAMFASGYFIARPVPAETVRLQPDTTGDGRISGSGGDRGFSGYGSVRLQLDHLELDPRAQQLRDTPRLRDAAARRKRRLRVEDLADRSDAGIIQVRDEAIERAARP